MNRKEIKEKAKAIVKENMKGFWKGYLVVFLISFLLSFAINILFKENSLLNSCASIVASAFLLTIEVGFSYYILKMVRGEAYSKEDIFKFVGNVIKILSIYLLAMLSVFFGLICFIIPGIIIAFGCAMMFMVYIDNPEFSETECIRKSKELMKGYKFDFWVFGMSFFGWGLLSLVTFGIALIWVLPYVSIATILYYDELKKLKENS